MQMLLGKLHEVEKGGEIPCSLQSPVWAFHLLNLARSLLSLGSTANKVHIQRCRTEQGGVEGVVQIESEDK